MCVLQERTLAASEPAKAEFFRHLHLELRASSSLCHRVDLVAFNPAIEASKPGLIRKLLCSYNRFSYRYDILKPAMSRKPADVASKERNEYNNSYRSVPGSC